MKLELTMTMGTAIYAADLTDCLPLPKKTCTKHIPDTPQFAENMLLQQTPLA